jgi:non-ribosomal peptide synthetase component F
MLRFLSILMIKIINESKISNNKHHQLKLTLIMDIISCFKRQVVLNGTAIAIQWEGKQVSYQELDRVSDNVASYIKSRYLESQIIGVYICSSIEFVTSVLGILKAGCSYLPIDVNMPWKHCEYIVRSSKIPMIVTTRQYLADLSPIQQNVIVTLFEECYMEQEKAETCLQEIHCDSLAYVIYTSGSTGVPNGKVSQIEYNNY